VFPALSMPIHSALVGLRMYLGDENSPRLLHVRLERTVPVDKMGGPPFLSERGVEAALFRDLPTLCHLGGQYHRVTAVYSGRSEQGVATATVTLSGDGLPDALWTVRVSEGEPSWRIVATTDEVDFGFRGGENPCIVIPTRELPTPKDLGKPLPEALSHEDVGLVQLDEFTDVLRRGEAAFDWPDLVRVYEMLDAVRRSLRRGRTIELHFEETSERSRFKTQMTAVGCGVLTLTFFGVLALLLVGSLFDGRTKTEKRAEQANAILYADEFRGDELTDAGRAHLDELARRLAGTSLPVVVEQTTGEHDRRRRQEVVSRLEAASVRDAETRVEVLPLAGPAFATVLRWARVVVFLPLALFLLAQLLLFVARPARSEP
jgi:hypothetical protein